MLLSLERYTFTIHVYYGLTEIRCETDKCLLLSCS